MNLSTITKKFILEVPGDFKPFVNIGSNVEIGSPLGRGQKYKVLQEVPLQGVDEIAVDDGVYVTKGMLLAKSSSLFNQRLWLSDTEGLVRITNSAIQVGDIEDTFKYTSFVKGRVVYAGTDKIVIDAQFFDIWLFASQGSIVKGHLYVVDNINGVITSKDIPNNVQGKIVFINGFLTRSIIIKAINLGAVGIIGISIDYDEYKKLGALLKYINLGVSSGFGQFVKPGVLPSILKMYNRHYVEVDFKNEHIYLPVHNVFSFNKKHYLFSSTRWGMPIEVLSIVNNHLIVKIESPSVKEKLEVDAAEVFSV